MPYCRNCGNELVENAKFCQKCGSKVTDTKSSSEERKTQYEGVLHKCPNCGESIKAFTKNCPSCGYEFRDVKAVSSVREFALKLEAIEASREKDGKQNIFTRFNRLNELSSTDEQKINLIKSFSIPNAKEDIYEFMILASSNVNTRIFDSQGSRATKSEIAVNDAWISKMKQAYEKARAMYGSDADFSRIQQLQNEVQKGISKAKRCGIIKWVLLASPLPALWIFLIFAENVLAPEAKEEELTRLVSIETEATQAMESGEYKKALLTAESLEYRPSVRGSDADKVSQQWDIKRELLIDEILEEAEKNGVHLEYTPSTDTDDDTINQTQ